MSTTSDSEDGEEENCEVEGPQTLEDLLMPRKPAAFTAEQSEELIFSNPLYNHQIITIS